MRRLPTLLALGLSFVAVESWSTVAEARRVTRNQKKGGKAKGKRGRRVAYERPIATYTRDGRPNIQADAAVLVDLQTGEELFQKRPDEVRPIASISKLMAAMVVLDRKLDLDGITEILRSDRDLALRGARSRLPPGMKFTNRDLLHAALIASDNRAVPALGRAVGLDPAQMTAAMNQKSRELGLAHTTFGDPTGLDERNRSTPRELARMLAAALKYPLISEITRKAQYVASPVGRPAWKIEYNNTDQVARGGRYQVLGGKTGYTNLAGYCLAIAARLADQSGKSCDVAMVFLGDHQKLTRFGDFSRAAQWVAERGAAAASTLPGPPAPAAGTSDPSL